jgi:hypothetical protein
MVVIAKSGPHAFVEQAVRPRTAAAERQHRKDCNGERFDFPPCVNAFEGHETHSAEDAGRPQQQRDSARSDQRDQEKCRAEGADNRARGGNAVNGARYRAGAARGAQHEPYGER